MEPSHRQIARAVKCHFLNLDQLFEGNYTVPQLRVELGFAGKLAVDCEYHPS